MDGEAIKTLVQFVLAMAGIMGLIWVIAAITPFLARKIDERLKKPSPERVEDSNDKTEEEYKVKGLYDKSEMENFDPNYKIYNTDIYGFGLAFDGLCGDVRGEKVLVIGAGGAAEAVLCALKNRGADVTVVNRTFSRGRELAEKYGMKAAETSIGLRPSVIVNCATVGNDGVSSPLSGREDLGDLKYAYDLVYSPAHTQFMKDCEKAGAKTSNGLSMLIYQAVVADEIFLGLDGTDRKRLFAAAESAVKKELEK